MATIDQLCTSFLDLSPQEQYDLLRNVRQLRRTKPIKPKAFKKSAKGTRSTEAIIKGSGKNIDPTTLAKTLTPEQRLALLEEFGLNK